MTNTTPIGSLTTTDKYFSSIILEISSSAIIYLVIYLKWFEAKGISTFNDSLKALPLFMVSILANLSLLSSIVSAFFLIKLHFFVFSCFIPFFECFPSYFTALSTSSLVALTNVERTVPSTGDIAAHFNSGLIEGINSPFIKRS